MIKVTTITGAVEVFPTMSGESFRVDDPSGYLTIWGMPKLELRPIALFAPGQWVFVQIVEGK